MPHDLTKNRLIRSIIINLREAPFSIKNALIISLDAFDSLSFRQIPGHFESGIKRTSQLGQKLAS
jgi:hypothetical protein